MVQLQNITKKFGQHTAVDDLNLSVKQGEFLTLLGPSGCGKTTTLRMIAGFEKPSEGEVWIGEKQVAKVEPYNREVNTVFQSYSLFPHMTVFDNVAFGLKMKKVNKAAITERVNKVLDLVQLKSYSDRKPKQLSGGQQQRIAIARAIVNNPKVLLLDEPLGALDLKLRKQMQLELKHLQQTLGITFIYVTHDQEEALTMSDRIVVMNAGKIEQMGSPEEIYEKPATRFVADFIGETNIFEGTVTAVRDDKAYLTISGNEIMISNQQHLTVDEKVYMSVRPEKAKVTIEAPDGQCMIDGTIQEKIYVGSLTKVIVRLSNEQEIVVHQEDHHLHDDSLAADRAIKITWKPEHAVIFKG
ncbi:ABC transporter ATP-binding protein [Radiobacillus kanasensis]|uniref:ABC transporter ATP-binding protein n=1 Tax=Radiobacillus kanasensis TaxID=2844358 RepID=UPI001E5FE246|nr:ABC transporter ATP-binding protein [Radiobacillus kanasensis]UFU01453.1 ABC transporter ATP-binding protein [Radiobacillus kanasensis]